MHCILQNYCKYSREKADFHFIYTNPQACTLLSSCGNSQMFKNGNYLKSNENKQAIKKNLSHSQDFLLLKLQIIRNETLTILQQTTELAYEKLPKMTSEIKETQIGITPYILVFMCLTEKIDIERKNNYALTQM